VEPGFASFLKFSGEFENITFPAKLIFIFTENKLIEEIMILGTFFA